MYRKKNKSLSIILMLIGIMIVFFIGYNVRGKSTGFLFDESVMEFINDKTTDAGLKGMKIFTNLGSKYLFIVALVGLVAYYINRRQRRYARLVFTSIVGSYGLNAILKMLFTRVRPLDFMLIDKAGYSFPSGHAMVSMSFYTTMTYIMLDRAHSAGFRVFAWVVNFLMVFMIGFSRLYLGVHWPTDIIAGFIMGYIIFYVSKEKIQD